MAKERMLTGIITECVCGWRGEYDVDCDCLPCHEQGAAHRARHYGVPVRKPMARAKSSTRVESTLAQAIRYRAEG
jgi:hypothetical protein